jgi:DNA-binding response OmpR family regulator
MRLLLIASDQKQALSLATELRRLPHTLEIRSSLDADVPPALHLLVLATAVCDRTILEQLSRWRLHSPATALFVLLDSGDYHDRVTLLNAGADDVLSSPYVSDEFIARVQALLRRIDPEAASMASEPDQLSCRDLTINLKTRSVSRAGGPIRLTVKEYDLLLHLAKHQGVVLPRLDILKAVWGQTWVGDDNLLDVYIRYLRKKIDRPDSPPLIRTVRGVGFLIE